MKLMVYGRQPSSNPAWQPLWTAGLGFAPNPQWQFWVLRLRNNPRTTLPVECNVKSEYI